MDIDENRLPAPEAGVPYIGQFANDSGSRSKSGAPNCILAPAPRDSEQVSDRICRMGLYTIGRVASGDELLWDYGCSYRSRKSY